MAKAILTMNRIVPLWLWSRILPFRLGSSVLIGGSLCLGRVSFVSDRMRLNKTEWIIPGRPPFYIENQRPRPKDTSLPSILSEQILAIDYNQRFRLHLLNLGSFQTHLGMSNNIYARQTQAQTDIPSPWPDHKSSPARSHLGSTIWPDHSLDPAQLPETQTLSPGELSWIPADPAEWASSPAGWADLTWNELGWAWPSYV